MGQANVGKAVKLLTTTTTTSTDDVDENDSVRYMIFLWIHELSLDPQTLSKEPIQLCINSLIKSLLVMNFEELWRTMYSSTR